MVPARETVVLAEALAVADVRALKAAAVAAVEASCVATEVDCSAATADVVATSSGCGHQIEKQSMTIVK